MPSERHALYLNVAKYSELHPRRKIPFFLALLLINTPSVTLTASYSRLLTRGRYRKERRREEANCVTSFRLDAVSAPRDVPSPCTTFWFSQAYPSAHIHTQTHIVALNITPLSTFKSKAT